MTNQERSANQQGRSEAGQATPPIQARSSRRPALRAVPLGATFCRIIDERPERARR